MRFVILWNDGTWSNEEKLSRDDDTAIKLCNIHEAIEKHKKELQENLNDAQEHPDTTDWDANDLQIAIQELNWVLQSLGLEGEQK